MKRYVSIALVIGVIVVAAVTISLIYLPPNKVPSTSSNSNTQTVQLTNQKPVSTNTSDLKQEGFELINHTPAKPGYAEITVYKIK